MWEEGLRETYGELWGPDLVHSTCAFALFDQWVGMGAVEASELQRRAMATLGALPAPRGRVMVREKKERAAEAENNDWEEGSVEDGRWKRERAPVLRPPASGVRSLRSRSRMPRSPRPACPQTSPHLALLVPPP